MSRTGERRCSNSINRGWFHYLGRIKKSVRDNNSYKNKNVSPNILGRPLIYPARPGKVYVWETLMFIFVIFCFSLNYLSYVFIFFIVFLLGTLEIMWLKESRTQGTIDIMQKLLLSTWTGNMKTHTRAARLEQINSLCISPTVGSVLG